MDRQQTLTLNFVWVELVCKHLIMGVVAHREDTFDILLQQRIFPLDSVFNQFLELL